MFIFFLILKMNLINTYCKYLQNNKWFSKCTIDNYSRALLRLDKFLKNLTLWSRGVEECEQIKFSDISLYLMEQRDLWLQVRTCNLQISAIRSFLRFCWKFWFNVLDYKTIETWKELKKKIWFLTDEEQRSMIEYAKKDKSKDELTKTRDLAILMMFLYTWIRVHELCKIKVEEMSDELQIEWKWGTLRPTYLFNEHLRLCNLYLALRKWHKIESEYLFCSHANNSKWKKLSRNSIESIIRNIWINAGVKQKVRPHKLRHTFATNLLKKWNNIYLIKELLWHQSITTTEKYLWATNEELRNAIFSLEKY